MIIVNCSREGEMQSPGLKNIVKYCEQLGFTTRMYFLDEIREEDILEAPGIVLSGSPRLLTNEPELIERVQFLKNVNIPILGICFGHQLLGALYGAKVFDLGIMVKGMQEVEFLQQEKIFSGYSQKMLFDQEHRQYIDLPPCFRQLARSKICDVEAMRHETKPIFSVQFHPERLDSTAAPLFEQFATLCKSKILKIER